VDYRLVAVDRDAHAVFLPKPGMRLDFGGIAKGYAADRIAALLQEKRVKRAVIDLGGNIYLHGAKPDRTPWRVGVKDPEDHEGSPALTLTLWGSATVVTSGGYERFFQADGKTYHHILDPKTGYPADSGLLATTIVASSSLAADALSTATFVLGAAEVQRRYPAGFIDATATAGILLFQADRTLWATPDVRDETTVLKPAYGF
jgi:thiamine biosynthesis lipoprotein